MVNTVTQLRTTRSFSSSVLHVRLPKSTSFGYFLYDNDLGTVTIFYFVIPLRCVQITHGKYNKSRETETFDCRKKEKKEIYTIASRRKVLEKVR